MIEKGGWINFFERVVTPRYQIGGLIFTSIIIFLLCINTFYRFISLEPTPQVFSVTPKQVKEWGGGAAQVIVGLHIINFPRFDIVKNDFVIDAIIWFEFDPAVASLETIEKFSFEKGDILKKSISNTKVIEGRFFAQYNITVQFTTNLAFQFFPLDDHRIFLTLTNKFVSPSEVVFESYISGFTVSDRIFVAGWKMLSRKVITGYSEAYLDENDRRKVVLNPNVVFSIDFARAGAQQMFLIFLPLYLMFFIGIISFAFSDRTERPLVLALSLGSVTAILSYSFVIQGMSPHMGYFLLSDCLFTLFLTFSVTGFLLNVLFMFRESAEPFWIVMRGVVYILFHIMLIFTWYYLLYKWIVV